MLEFNYKSQAILFTLISILSLTSAVWKLLVLNNGMTMIAFGYIGQTPEPIFEFDNKNFVPVARPNGEIFGSIVLVPFFNSLLVKHLGDPTETKGLEYALSYKEPEKDLDYKNVQINKSKVLAFLIDKIPEDGKPFLVTFKNLNTAVTVEGTPCIGAVLAANPDDANNGNVVHEFPIVLVNIADLEAKSFVWGDYTVASSADETVVYDLLPQEEVPVYAGSRRKKVFKNPTLEETSFFLFTELKK